jgi:hypothetical protein
MAEREFHEIMFSRGLVQAMYRCENCGTETTRTLKRDLTIALTLRRFAVESETAAKPDKRRSP